MFILPSPALFAGPPATEPPRLFRDPTVSAESVVFCLGDELWRVSRAGGEARPIEIGPGPKRRPCFSPDGRQIAFTWNRNGDDGDVYVVDSAGGSPRRLTYYPGTDESIGWTPDGQRILFQSGRDAATPVPHLFTISARGGPATELRLPIAREGSFSPDGTRLAYVPMAPWQESWKGYRGGQTKSISLVDLRTLETLSVPRSNSNDFAPQWVGRTVYFLSDREGPSGLYAFDLASRKVRRLVSGAGFELKSLAAGPGTLAYARVGSLHLFDLRTGQSRPLNVVLPEAAPELAPRTMKIGSRLEAGGVTGQTAVFQARGEIVTLSPNGDWHNLSRTPGAMDRDPVWSPDGKSIASFSDASGEYRLRIQKADGSEPHEIDLGVRPGFPANPVWSPDGTRIAYQDSHLRLWWVDLRSGRRILVDTNPKPWQPTFDFGVTWSPDGRWLVYARQLETYMSAVFAFRPETGERRRITGGLADVRSPAFAPDGKLLYVTASVDVAQALWIPDMSSIGRAVTRRVYAIPFGRPGPAPQAFALPLAPRNYRRLLTAPTGQLFTVAAPDSFFPFGSIPLRVGRYDPATKQEELVADGIDTFSLSARSDTCLIRKGTDWWIVPANRALTKEDRPLPVDGLEATADPKREWAQMYRDAFRIVRESFYDPKFHGLDLAKEERRYRPFLAGLRSRSDLNFLFEEILGDLGSSHTSAGGGDLPSPSGTRCGLLGADFVAANGRYRFARIYDGELWNAWPIPPLVGPGVNVQPGEYLLSVEGREVDLSDEVYRWFDGRAGTPTKIRVGPRPDGVGARELTVVPIENDDALRRNTWVEANRRRVDRLSGGQVGYVYLPNTHINGQAAFNREFFGQTGKRAMVIDARFNGGGFTADYMIEHLQRPAMGFLQGQQGDRITIPAAGIFGPKALVTNELAGSGGDALVWMFRKAKLGPIVGKRTWGGLRAVMGSVPLLDGGYFNVPQLAFWNLDGSWAVENRGVHPDVEVDLDLKSWASGHDLQLETATRLVLDALRKRKG